MSEPDKNLEGLSAALAKYLEGTLKDPEQRTAALAEVARKLLADNDFQYGKAQLPKVESMAKSLATVDPETAPPPIPALRS